MGCGGVLGKGVGEEWVWGNLNPDSLSHSSQQVAVSEAGDLVAVEQHRVQTGVHLQRLGKESHTEVLHAVAWNKLALHYCIIYRIYTPQASIRTS